MEGADQLLEEEAEGDGTEPGDGREVFDVGLSITAQIDTHPSLTFKAGDQSPGPSHLPQHRHLLMDTNRNSYGQTGRADGSLGNPGH